MFSKTLVAAALVAGTAFVDASINTPAALVQCQPVQLSWDATQGPYILDVIPGGQPGAAPLEEITSGTQATSITWKVDVPANTDLSFKLTDASGQIFYSSPVTVQAGADSSCLGASASPSAVAGASSTVSAKTVSAASSTAGSVYPAARPGPPVSFSNAFQPLGGSSVSSTAQGSDATSSAGSSDSSSASSASSVASSASSSASSAASSASASHATDSASHAASSPSNAAATAKATSSGSATGSAAHSSASTPTSSAASTSSSGAGFISAPIQVPALLLAFAGALAALF